MKTQPENIDKFFENPFLANERQKLDQILSGKRSKEQADSQLFYLKLNYFVNNIDKLIAYITEKGDELLSLDEESAYAKLVEQMDLAEEYPEQIAKLKILCLSLIEKMQIIKKYAKYAEEQPNAFFENEVISRRGFFETKRNRKFRKPIKFNVKPFCIELIMYAKDFRKISFGEGAMFPVGNTELDGKIYGVKKSRANTDTERHEELHILFDNFVSHDYEKRNSFPNPTETLGMDDIPEIISTFKNCLYFSKDKALSIFQSEAIAYASGSIPQLNNYADAYGFMGFEIAVNTLIHYIKINRKLSDKDKKELLELVLQNIEEYRDKSVNYLNSVRRLYKHSNLSHGYITALLLSTPIDKLPKIVEHFTNSDYVNPVWNDIEKYYSDYYAKYQENPEYKDFSFEDLIKTGTIMDFTEKDINKKINELKSKLPSP